MEKDYSLLRPFDLEAAKRGEPICWHDGEDEGLVYISGPDCEKNICYSFEGKLFLYSHTYFRMAPQTWVEGKPVYKGDVLYSDKHGKGEIVEDRRFVGGAAIKFEGTWISLDAPYFATGLTWTPPKVKREGYWVANKIVSAKSKAEAEVILSEIPDPQNWIIVRSEWEE